MMKKLLIFLLVTFLSLSKHRAQDTFSILAFDSITGEVGAAGASCVNLFSFPGFSNDFICELFPGVGAIATQASYIPANQVNARNRMNAGDSPNQILNWLQANDVQSNPSVRQYGVVRMMPDSVQTAAFTGSNCMAYKNHIVGPNYTIHGNILLGQMVLDSMQARFLREPGDLACKLMAAMQGAKMIGADTRCAGNGSSSLFAFIKVTQPGDVFGNPSFLLSLKTQSTAGIEPIDSLQNMFNAVKTCTVDWVSLKEQANAYTQIKVFPNPAEDDLSLEFTSQPNAKRMKAMVYNVYGQLMREESLEVNQNKASVNCRGLANGTYFLLLQGKDAERVVKKFVVYRG
jgi:uncharacterized Ntn-hydrolase superfamily protein